MKPFLATFLLAALLALCAIPAQARQAPEPQGDPEPPAASVPTPTAGTADPRPATPPAATPATPATPAPATAASTATANPKNDRIFMVIPNYTTVEQPKDFMPISVKEKFKLGALDAFDPYSFPLAAIVAGFAQAGNDDASWGQGLKGYGKRYAAAYADTVSGSFMTTGVFPSMLHEDPRYFRKGTGNFWSRSGYAVKRLLVIRTDSGGTTFNFSEFGGNAVAGALSLTYHSSEDRNFTNFVSDFGTQIAIDFVANQLKEFWPDIRHRFLHH
jgi:hypothetical protein